MIYYNGKYRQYIFFNFSTVVALFVLFVQLLFILNRQLLPILFLYFWNNFIKKEKKIIQNVAYSLWRKHEITEISIKFYTTICFKNPEFFFFFIRKVKQAIMILLRNEIMCKVFSKRIMVKKKQRYDIRFIYSVQGIYSNIYLI